MTESTQVRTQASCWAQQYKDLVGTVETPCGIGSTMEATGPIRDGLEQIISSFGLKSLTDIPCGDMNWMRHVNLTGVD